MNLTFWYSLLIYVIFAFLFMWHALIFVEMRRAKSQTEIPVPYVWKIIVIFNILFAIAAFLFIVL